MADTDMEIDLNADLGEGAGYDEELLRLVSSANLCCGVHAGSRQITAETLNIVPPAVSIGAHPGYDDPEHFGRRELALSPDQVSQLCLNQIRELQALAKGIGREIVYVKPHGAMYNQACRNEETARGVVEAVRAFQLPLVGLPGSVLERIATANQVPFIREGFADRRYREGGSLVPRSEPNAMLHDPVEAVEQVIRLIQHQQLHTICIHGDHPDSLLFAGAVRQALLDRGFTLRAFA